jgi:hypothetical protein
MTPKEARQRIGTQQVTLDIAYRKLKALRESRAGICGIYQRPYFDHEIEITQAAIIRLQNRIERLEIWLK